MEGDAPGAFSRTLREDFYPRPHMEGDLRYIAVCLGRRISTHALTWRATAHDRVEFCQDAISTHALTWRATASNTLWLFGREHFCPRPHMEGDLLTLDDVADYCDFYPRPHMEGDQRPQRTCQSRRDFYPRPHMEGDLRQSTAIWSPTEFLPTPSHGGRLLCRTK